MNLEKLPFEAPYLTTPQMVEVDRAMIEDFKIELIQMMENAGRNLAHLRRTRFLDLCCAARQRRSVHNAAGWRQEEERRCLGNRSN